MTAQEQGPCLGCMSDKEWGPKRDKCAQCPQLKDWWQPPRLWWCNSHNRRATHQYPDGRHRCDPSKGGILLPCVVVDLTGQLEFISEPANPDYELGGDPGEPHDRAGDQRDR